jgi:hypothetical protein
MKVELGITAKGILVFDWFLLLCSVKSIFPLGPLHVSMCFHETTSGKAV